MKILFLWCSLLVNQMAGLPNGNSDSSDIMYPMEQQKCSHLHDNGCRILQDYYLTEQHIEDPCHVEFFKENCAIFCGLCPDPPIMELDFCEQDKRDDCKQAKNAKPDACRDFKFFLECHKTCTGCNTPWHEAFLQHFEDFNKPGKSTSKCPKSTTLTTVSPNKITPTTTTHPTTAPNTKEPATTISPITPIAMMNETTTMKENNTTQSTTVDPTTVTLPEPNATTTNPLITAPMNANGNLTSTQKITTPTTQAITTPTTQEIATQPTTPTENTTKMLMCINTNPNCWNLQSLDWRQYNLTEESKCNSDVYKVNCPKECEEGCKLYNSVPDSAHWVNILRKVAIIVKLLQDIIKNVFDFERYV